jgi:putative PIN family toxin of toxin-antitoxin system
VIRVVLDTNVIVSALLQALGPPAQALVLATGGPIQLCISGNVYAEYDEVISRPRFRRSIREKGLWVRPTKAIRVCSDPDDDIFLECAHAAQANTGNLKHFPTSWSGTRIVAVRHLLDLVLSGTGGEAASI